jgi:hypothetical protein
MNGASQIQVQLAYERHALFAVELLDGVTLERVSIGIVVTAEGLRGKPVVNYGGLFVWLEEKLDLLQKILVDPGELPYEQVERTKAELTLPPAPRPLTTIELPPRIDYPFAAGITGVRGILIEDRTAVPVHPIAGAAIALRWLDDTNVWHDAVTISHTNDAGDFVSILRLSAADIPLVDAAGALTVRLRVRRDVLNERHSADLHIPQGRIADPTTLNALVVAWDELQP